MDAGIIIALTAGVCAGTALGARPLTSRLTGGVARRAQNPGPDRASPPPVHPDELTPYELAYLAGDPGGEHVRVGEVALMDLFLTGRVRVRSEAEVLGDRPVTAHPDGAWVTPVEDGAGNPHPGEPDPLQHHMLSLLRSRGGTPAPFLVDDIPSDEVGRLRRGLVERGLSTRSGDVPGVLDRRRDASGSAVVTLLSSVVLTAILLFTAVTGAGPGTADWWIVFILSTGGTAALLSVTALARVGGAGGATATPVTAAGASLLARARESYGAPPLGGGRLTLDQALRHTAVLGFRGLRRVSGQGPVLSPSSARADDGERIHRFEELSAFARRCQGDPTGRDWNHGCE
ncbi:TIGR04222 domain-containing membrane protein [Nocardiopsis sp. FIRDI 009]|uniref:TIGR04222 domain-containing membrane protein n=1 Tax=Nocardiopsis sp. FIRDI 009 TaxID=714197 RepID=UPI0013008F22|nr:TIGR04222 domain-containing membrane protein [Nocardiopsis sp. FIRDI 009]